MTQPGWSWLAVVLGLLLGLFAIFTASGWAVWLGVIAVVLSVGLGISELRRSRSDVPEPVPGQIPELTSLERLLPGAFYIVTILIVLAALIYTFLQLGLI